MHHAARHRAALDALARFPFLEQVVEGEVPDDGQRGGRNGHAARMPGALAYGHEQQAGGDDGDEFVQGDENHPALGALQALCC
jgi:hypothetical protein